MDQRKAAAVLELIASGQTLSEACRQPGMPSRSAVYAWLDADEEFNKRYERALERGGDAVADYAHHIAANTTRENASANRVILDALKWRASRLNSRYALPSGADGAADDDAPRVDLEGARNRLMARFDEIADRVESYDCDHHLASRLISTAVRRLEDRQRLDPIIGEDRALIIDEVQRAITPPAFAPASGLVKNGTMSEIGETAVLSDGDAVAAEIRAGRAVPYDEWLRRHGR
jgi:hypothetical protein